MCLRILRCPCLACSSVYCLGLVSSIFVAIFSGANFIVCPTIACKSRTSRWINAYCLSRRVQPTSLFMRSEVILEPLTSSLGITEQLASKLIINMSRSKFDSTRQVCTMIAIYYTFPNILGYIVFCVI